MIKYYGAVLKFFQQLNLEWHNWCPTVPDSACMKFGIDACGIEYPDRLSVSST